MGITITTHCKISGPDALAGIDRVLCGECCNESVRLDRPEVVTLDEDGICPNCGRWHARFDTTADPVPCSECDQTFTLWEALENEEWAFCSSECRRIAFDRELDESAR